MGLLVHGKWVDRWYNTEGHEGHFVRKAAQFRNWVTADGSPGPSSEKLNTLGVPYQILGVGPGGNPDGVACRAGRVA